MTRTVIRRCLALLGTDAVPSNGPVDVAIEGNRIAAIGAAESLPGDAVIDGRDRLLTAGLINGHFHSHEHLQKGRFENLPLELWMNYVRPPKPIPLTARQVYLRTMVGAIEALRSGTTTVVDDLNLGPALDRTHLAAAHQAYEDIGIRALVGLSMMDRPFFETIPYVSEEFEPNLLAELRALPLPQPENIWALCRDLAARRHPSRHRVGFILAPSAPQRCTTAFLQRARQLADEFDLPLMIHVQETRLQVVTALITEGSTFVEHLDRIGFLKPKTTLIHAVWLTPHEVELISRSGASVQHNPWSNLRLGSGIAPIRALTDAGVNVSLGTDGCASTDTCNMLNSVSLTAVLNKVRGDDNERWIGAKDAWRAATIGGAVALGRGADLGAVEVGRTADLVLFRLDRIPFAPLNDALRQLVYAERGASIDTVLVDGAVVMSDGRLTGVDEGAIVAEIAAEHAKLEPLIAEAERSVSRMRPALERIYRRCLAHPVAPDTFGARLC